MSKIKKVKSQTNISLALLLLLFSFFPVLVQAVGLGNAHVISKLNEPLNVELEVLASDSKELYAALPHLASAQDFEQAGISRSDYLNGLQIKLEDKHGKPIVRLTTSEPVKDPVVNLLLEITGSKGRILKEFTVLLDPPEFGNQPSNHETRIKIKHENNSAAFDAFQEKMPTMGVGQAAKQQEQNQIMQARLNKVETELKMLAEQKQDLEHSKTLLKEENDNLHDLVQLKQKEIDSLHFQPTTPDVNHVNQAQTLSPSLNTSLETEMKSNTSSFNPWVWLGVILIAVMASVFGLKEFFKRKALAFTLDGGFDKELDEADWPKETSKNKSTSFQEAISSLQMANQVDNVATQTQPVASSNPQIKRGIKERLADPLTSPSATTSTSTPRLEDAEVYITFGKFKLAEDLLLKILEREPNNTKARFKWIDLLFTQNKFTEAEAQFKLLPPQAASDYPEQYKVYKNRFHPEPVGDSQAPKAETIGFQKSDRTEEFVQEYTRDNAEELEPSEELKGAFDLKPAAAFDVSGSANLSPKTHIPEENSANPSLPPISSPDLATFQTKLDFAKVYIEMKDVDSARDLLNEVIQSGPEKLKKEAQELLTKL